MFSIFFLITG